MAKPGPKGKDKMASSALGGSQPTTTAPPINASSEGLDSLLAAMNKRFGKGALRTVDASSEEATVDVISTGSLSLDVALGIGGLPRGRIVEIYGPESSGKTTLTLHVIAEAQRQGLQCAFIDAEHALDVKYARDLGVDTAKLLIAQPDSGEQGLDILDELCKSGQVGVVILDSIAALTPKAELEGDMSTSLMGVHARMMSRIMRKVASSAAKNNVLVYLINQIRMKIGVMFGSPETTTGGQAVKYFASVRLDIRRIGGVKGGGSESFTGNETKVTVKKNKMAPPFKEALFEITFGRGIDKVSELLDMGKEHGVLVVQSADRTKNGNTWFFDSLDQLTGETKSNKLGNSRDAAKETLEASPELQADIRRRLLDKLLTVKVAATTEADREALAARIEAEKYIPENGAGGDPLDQVAAFAAGED